MKNTTVISVALLAILLSIGISCSRPIEKKLAGTWKVEDVRFETQLQIDPKFLEESKESQKTISYELLEDYSAKINAGFSTFEGSWVFRENDKSVHMVFSGTFDTILLGRYEEGKLINEDVSDDFKITTIFVRQEP
jgi:hypothetical protein